MLFSSKSMGVRLSFHAHQEVDKLRRINRMKSFKKVSLIIAAALTSTMLVSPAAQANAGTVTLRNINTFNFNRNWKFSRLLCLHKEFSSRICIDHTWRNYNSLLCTGYSGCPKLNRFDCTSIRSSRHSSNT